MPVPRQDLCRV